MSWTSDRWRAIKNAAGHRRYVLGGLITAALAAFDLLKTQLAGVPSMTALVGLPSVVVAIIVGVGLLAFWLLERLVYLENRITVARMELARLRTRGVEIRNRGIKDVDTDQKWNDWQRDALIWNRDVVEAVRKISEADAEWFSILDVVPPARVQITKLPPQHVAGEFIKLYGEHDFRLQRLGEMVYSLWRE